MAVCKFYLQGFCRYGDRCWNEHPRDQRNQGKPLEALFNKIDLLVLLHTTPSRDVKRECRFQFSLDIRASTWLWPVLGLFGFTWSSSNRIYTSTWLCGLQKMQGTEEETATVKAHLEAAVTAAATTATKASTIRATVVAVIMAEASGAKQQKKTAKSPKDFFSWRFLGNTCVIDRLRGRFVAWGWSLASWICFDFLHAGLFINSVLFSQGSEQIFSPGQSERRRTVCEKCCRSLDKRFIPARNSVSGAQDVSQKLFK